MPYGDDEDDGFVEDALGDEALGEDEDNMVAEQAKDRKVSAALDTGAVQDGVDDADDTDDGDC